jgi:hypothetical protein
MINTVVTLTVFLHVPLELVHEDGAVALQLLVAADRAEGDLPESLLRVGPVADAAYRAPVPDHGHGDVSVVEHQPHDIFLGHLWQLTGEDVLQVHQPDARFVGVIVRDDFECDTDQIVVHLLLLSVRCLEIL